MAFDNAGNPLWRNTCCGGGPTPSLYRGRIYSPGGDGPVFDAATGEVVDHLVAHAPVAFADGTAYRIFYGNLEAVDLDTKTVEWTFDTAARIQAPPLVVGDVVFVANAHGSLTAVRRSDGAVLWHDRTGHHVYSSDISERFVGMAAADHRLVVPTQGRLFVYEPR